MGRALLLLLGASGALGLGTRRSLGQNPSFDDFIQFFDRSYQPGSEEYTSRKATFEQHVNEIAELNQRPGWDTLFRVNHLSDRTADELSRLNGFKPSMKPTGGGTMAIRVAQHQPRAFRNTTTLPTEVNWKGKVTATKKILDQGPCGSCWAIGAVTVLNAHSELYGTAQEFSVQQIVSCAPNPQECGGKGGCDGATAELALDHVMEADLMTENAFPYVASDKACPASVQTKMDSPNLVAAANPLTSFGMFGYSSLPTNKLFPLMQAVAEQGPVSVGVAVAPGFNWYFGGIFEDCSTWVINHLVTLIGYGELYGKKYWHIQNSWGAYWGENGFMKLQRLDDAKEEALCGWDYEPEKGLGCKGGPPKVWVCGSCGILLDGVVPHFKLKSNGWYARVGGRKPEM